MSLLLRLLMGYQANLAVKLILNYFKRSTKWRLRQLSRSRHFRGLDFPWQANICPQGVVFGNYPYRHMWHRLRQIKSPNCKIWWVSAMFQLLVFLQIVNTGPLINLWMMQFRFIECQGWIHRIADLFDFQPNGML